MIEALKVVIKNSFKNEESTSKKKLEEINTFLKKNIERQVKRNKQMGDRSNSRLEN